MTMTFRYGSVCSGIEAATAAWHHMGWEAAFFSEIDKFPCAVLEHRYPDVPLHGDFTTIKENEYGKIDLLVGGTPCQSFSVAGLRGGLDDDRGNLALEFCRLAQREQPRWIVWENVPGVLSSSGGRDFGSILGALEDLGYGLAYRVLDAQYFGVAQRRRRVFVVGYLGDWRPAAAVLFERHSMSGHPAPSREKRQEATDTAATGTGGSGGNGRERSDLAENGSVTWPAEIAPTLNASFGDKQGLEDQHINGGAGLFVAAEVAPTLAARTKGGGGLGTDFDLDGGLIAHDVAGPLTAGMHKGPRGTEAVESGHVIASTFNDDGTARTLTARYDGSPCVDRGPDVVGTLRAHHPGTAGTQSDTDHIVAFSAKDYGADATEDLSPTLRAGGFTNSHQNGGVMPAVAYSIMPMNSGKDYKARETDISQPLMAGGPVGGNQGGDFILQQPVAYGFSKGDHGQDAGEDICPTIRKGGDGGGNMPAVAYALQDVRGLDKKQNGKGWSDEGVSYTVDTHATQGVAAFPINTQLGLRGPDVSNTSRDGFGVGDEADPAYTLQANHTHAVAYDILGSQASNVAKPTEVHTVLRSRTPGQFENSTVTVAMSHSTVRRLTPVECERLQGFPDNFTAIPWRKKGAEDCPDGPRYKALGNSMAVPVMRWIGERIRLVDDCISII